MSVSAAARAVSEGDAAIAAIRAVASVAIDFEGGDGDPSRLLPDGARADDYVTLGQHVSGSLICLRRPAAGEPLVVWLDSDGGDPLPLARSIDELASLLPYGTGLLYDLALAWQRRQRVRPRPLAPAARRAHLDLAAADLVRALLGVEPAADPVAVIGAAAGHRPG